MNTWINSIAITVFVIVVLTIICGLLKLIVHYFNGVESRAAEISFGDYKTDFKRKARGNQPSVATNAVSAILDIRKYEIEMYWKRATYFWAFIAVAYAGCGALTLSTLKSTSTPAPDETVIAAGIVANKLIWIITCFGLFLSVAWHLVNKGSKYWQENWENHLDLLENGFHGPLYKTVVSRRSRPIYDFCGHIKDVINGPSAISVSKVNASLSFFNIVVWFGILVHLIGINYFSDKFIDSNTEIRIVVIGTVVAIILMTAISGTNQTDRLDLRATQRKVEISPK